MTPSTDFRAKDIERFMAKVHKTDSCWVWTRAVNSKGYGFLEVNKVNWLAHRFSYTISKGEIPKGLIIMHSCDNRKCVNPEHLSAGTQSDNILDCAKKGRHHGQKVTHCPKGHEYTPENTIVKKQNRAKSPGVYRACKQCHRQHQKTYNRNKTKECDIK